MNVDSSKPIAVLGIAGSLRKGSYNGVFSVLPRVLPRAGCVALE
jgi:NAD(P)H-dependent FMN reductase